MMLTNRQQESRQIRGYAIISKGDEPEQIGKDVFLVNSQSSNAKYHVVRDGSIWTCDCPDYKYRGLYCKHIFSVEFWLNLKQKITNDTFDLRREAPEKLVCGFCASERIIKHGKRKCDIETKQRFYCKNCNKTFVLDVVKKFKGNEKVITLVMDLYFKGLSLRKIKHHLKQFYNFDIDHATIYRWIVRFTKVMSKYAERLQPQLSDTWNADEQMIKSNGKNVWSWNVLDEKTRFLIANKISNGRDIQDARNVFSEAKEIADCKPKKIITDGLWSYEKAIGKEFWHYPRTEHIRNVGIRSKTNNNLIERYHSTFRERDKVMRGFKSDKTAQKLTDGFKVYYNFIRPHMALGGLTPSQVAGIEYSYGDNKWLGLFKEAMKNNGHKEIKKNVIFQLRIFDQNGIEIEPKKLGIQSRIPSRNKVDEFIGFYRRVYPNYVFKVSETSKEYEQGI